MSPELKSFMESKTGKVMAVLMFVASFGACLNTQASNPSNFPNLGSRFRIEQSLDSDKVYRLSVHRSDNEPINWYDNDLVALERVIKAQCGELSKFEGGQDAQGLTPVNFRVYRSDPVSPECTFIHSA